MPSLEIPVQLYPKQLQALFTPATECLFGGASEGGKSFLLRAALTVWCMSIPGLQCVLIRKKKDDILKNHLYGPSGFKATLYELEKLKRVHITQDSIRFIHADGPESVIAFQHCQDERQFTSAQGVEKHVVAIDEATQLSERLIKMFRLWTRASLEFKAALPEIWQGKFPRIIYTANPIGPSVPFFRRQFVKARPEGHIEKVAGFLRQYIPSRVIDNPSADLEAHMGRMENEERAMARALHDGDWDAPLGDFYPEFDEERHVVPDFVPPAHWYRYRSFDWGSADPFAVYWFAVSDGEMFETDVWNVDPNTGMMTKLRRKLWFPRGAKIVYREWYGCREDEPAKGIGMRNSDIARGILERSVTAEEKHVITLTDSFVFPDRGEEGGQTIAKTFRDCGVPLTLGDTSRVTGWASLRDALIGQRLDLNVETRYPMIYICECCKYARDYIPALPRHPNEAKRHEDAAESGEATHSCDAIRLGNMALAPAKDKPVPDVQKIMGQIKNAKIQPTFDDAVKMLKRQKRSGAKRF